jgi:rifampicin phosphotransferase
MLCLTKKQEKGWSIMELLRCLQDIGPQDIGLVGGKAANLGALLQNELPVPPGFVLLTSAYQQFLIACGIQPEIEQLVKSIDISRPTSIEQASVAIRTLFEQGNAPQVISHAISSGYERMGCGSVAVRSSATAEDLLSSSFAGQQESYLNVTGAEQVLSAVKRCWSSLWTARAMAYRTQRGITANNIRMAVIVQQMVPASASGVLFTINPVTGNQSEIVINAVWGLGEALVSGYVTPDTIIVDKASGEVKQLQVADKDVMTILTTAGTAEAAVESQQRRETALSTEQIAQLASLGREIEAIFGHPQDIEWAIADGQIYILQARPVTAQSTSAVTVTRTPIPIPPGDDSWDRQDDKPAKPYDLWTRTNFGENLPFPISPLTSTGFPYIMGQGGQDGQSRDEPQMARRFYGRLYINEGAVMHNLTERYGLPSSVIDSMWGSRRRGKHQAKGKFRPWRLLRSIPSLLRSLARLRKNRGPKQTPAQFFAQIDSWVNDFLQHDMTAMDDRALWFENVPAWREHGAYVFRKNIAISAPAALNYGLLERLVGRWTRHRELTHDLVTGIAGVYSAEVGPLLWHMAQTLRDARLESVVLDHPARDTLALLRQQSGAQPFFAQLEEFLQRHGHRCPNEIEFLHPRWTEAPEQVIELIAGYLRAGESINPIEAEQRQVQRREEAIAAVAKRPGPVRRKIFRVMLTRAQQAVRTRDNSRYYVTKFFFPMRSLFAQLGQRWAERGWIKEPDDIFFLTITELEKLVTSENPTVLGADLPILIANRRLAYEYWFTVVPPEVIGPDGQPVFDEEEQETTLAGVAVSGGRVRGIARIVLDPREATRLRPGEILVTQATDPGWTPVFPLVSGLVLEIGGQLSHGAIVAREYGIPAVVNVQGAMRHIHDGQVITIDGTEGRVYLHELSTVTSPA